MATTRVQQLVSTINKGPVPKTGPQSRPRSWRNSSQRRSSRHNSVKTNFHFRKHNKGYKGPGSKNRAAASVAATKLNLQIIDETLFILGKVKTPVLAGQLNQLLSFSGQI